MGDFGLSDDYIMFRGCLYNAIKYFWITSLIVAVGYTLYRLILG